MPFRELSDDSVSRIARRPIPRADDETGIDLAAVIQAAEIYLAETCEHVRFCDCRPRMTARFIEVAAALCRQGWIVTHPKESLEQDDYCRAAPRPCDRSQPVRCLENE